ncbi:UvrD-helicase domain-containing protein [Frankia sp. ArI3]|uniref:UvrD-helicase domain-containing protein n=1 Tax=Frankia sp. ArI3 TaxID=1858 RepID=UPI001C6FC8AA|nr:UvrD-helicase domain-containing protein [Frankia sp. ArI3]
MAGSGIALRLPAPVGKQKDVIYLDEGGEHLVLGTAGSGKTLMAIYRAVYLAQHAPRNAGSTLLLTFHQTLVTYIKSLVPADTKQLTIETFHGFARGYLASQDMLRDNEILTPSNHERFLAHAAAQVASRLGTSTIFDKKPAFFADEYRFIVGHRQRRDQYIAANDGRGHALNQQQRSRIYDVMERYWSLRREHGFRYCWDDLAPIAARQLRGDTTERRYKHIVVDESQDLPPAAVDALTQATGVGGSLTLFGDYAQQIHLAGTASADIGLENAKLTIFQDNYRNTAQISRLALALSRLPTFRSNADLVEPREPRADGAPPTIWRHADQTQQMTAAVQLAQQDSLITPSSDSTSPP